jgi:hypothetical protein
MPSNCFFGAITALAEWPTKRFCTKNIEKCGAKVAKIKGGGCLVLAI